jgi:hypothetical protein
VVHQRRPGHRALLTIIKRFQLVEDPPPDRVEAEVKLEQDA